MGGESGREYRRRLRRGRLGVLGRLVDDKRSLRPLAESYMLIW